MVRASVRAACVLLAAAAMLAIEPSGSGASAGGGDPIGKLAGRWAGDGTMVPTSGRNERFRCIVTYAVGEDASRVRQHLRCQGEDSSFDAVTRLDISADRVTGVWVENTYSINGTVRGWVTKNGFDIRLLGTFFQARMMVATTACEQSVKVLPEGSGNMKEMAAVLTKSDRAKICDPARIIVPPVPVPAQRPAHLVTR
jgi:hypothetical protein